MCYTLEQMIHTDVLVSIHRIPKEHFHTVIEGELFNYVVL